MKKLNLGFIKIAFYENGAIVMAVKTGFKKTDFELYILRHKKT